MFCFYFFLGGGGVLKQFVRVRLSLDLLEVLEGLGGVHGV